jgi:hypothetical protein
VRQYIDDEILPFAFEWESAGKVPDSARDHYLSIACSKANGEDRCSNDMQNWGIWRLRQG